MVPDQTAHGRKVHARIIDKDNTRIGTTVPVTGDPIGRPDRITVRIATGTGRKTTGRSRPNRPVRLNRAQLLHPNRVQNSRKQNRMFRLKQSVAEENSSVGLPFWVLSNYRLSALKSKPVRWHQPTTAIKSGNASGYAVTPSVGLRPPAEEPSRNKVRVPRATGMQIATSLAKLRDKDKDKPRSQLTPVELRIKTKPVAAIPATVGKSRPNAK